MASDKQIVFFIEGQDSLGKQLISPLDIYYHITADPQEDDEWTITTRLMTDEEIEAIPEV